MPIEAELKARVHDAGALLAALDARAEREEDANYRDRYFDNADGSFIATGHEQASAPSRRAARPAI